MTNSVSFFLSLQVGNISLPLLHISVKSWIIHTPKKLSKTRVLCFINDTGKSAAAEGGLWLQENLSDLHGRRRWVSRVPFPHYFSIISSASQRDIVLGDKCEQRARAQTVRGRSPPSNPPSSLPFPPPTILSAAAVSSLITIIVF